MTGLEPAISGLTGRRDNQLRHIRINMDTMPKIVKNVKNFSQQIDDFGI